MSKFDKKDSNFIQFHRGWKVSHWDSNRPITGLWEASKDEDITITAINKNLLFTLINTLEDNIET